VDRNRYLTLKEAKAPGYLMVKNVGHFLYLDEVISRPECAQLGAAPLFSPGADRRRICTIHGTPFFKAF
jgi:hypothetical protein